VNYSGALNQYGGTSCGAPLWAGFMALVNQARVANDHPVIGFVNPVLYSLGKSSIYDTVFHDIKDESTNGFYPAVSGYDDATGWGTLIGDSLLAALSTK
jgi:subtilase family serine protease